MTDRGLPHNEPPGSESATSTARAGGFVERYGSIVAFGLITVSTWLVYSNTLLNPFIFDDRLFIFESAALRDPLEFLTFTGTRSAVLFTFSLNRLAGGADPFGYHVVNTLIHMINGLLVWRLVAGTLGAPAIARCGVGTDDREVKYFIALSAALLFVCHPLQTQAVTYITQRFASLATLFYLSSLLLYLNSRLAQGALRRGAFYLLSLASAVVAMKCKEIAFTLPLIIILYEFTFLTRGAEGRGRRLLRLAPFLLTLLIIPLTIFGPELGLFVPLEGIGEETRSFQITDLTAISPYQYLITQARVVVKYLRLIVLPAAQSADYDMALFDSIFEPQVFLSTLLVGAMVLLAIFVYARSLKTRSAYGLVASFGMLWFFITLSIESSFIPVKDAAFEHRLYLPLAGMALCFSTALYTGLERLWSRQGAKTSPLTTAWAILAITTVLLGTAAHLRNRVWSDEGVFWKDVVEKSPRNARGHNNLGYVYGERGRQFAAMRHLRIAIELKPDYADAYNNLGLSYYRQDEPGAAIEYYDEAIRLNSGFAEARNNRAVAYYILGRVTEAIAEFRLAIRIKPDFDMPRNNLDRALRAAELTGKSDRFIRFGLEAGPGS